MAEQTRVEQSVFDVIDEFNRTLPSGKKLKKSMETTLFGKHGGLDSLGLVNLVVAVEQKIEEEFGVPVSLADERAMSQEKSPFRTVDALVKYILLLLSENGN